MAIDNIADMNATGHLAPLEVDPASHSSSFPLFRVLSSPPSSQRLSHHLHSPLLLLSEEVVQLTVINNRPTKVVCQT